MSVVTTVVDSKMRVLLIAALIAVCGATGAAQQNNSAANIPESAARLFKSTGLDRQYSISSHLKPSYLRADFDGDGKPDIAFPIKQKKSGKIGLAISHSSTNKIVVLGAGTALGNGGDDFEWMDVWGVVAKSVAARRLGKAAALTLKGDALHIEKSETAGGLIYWNGKRYVWRQQGD